MIFRVEKSCPDAATPGQQMAMDGFWGTTISEKQHTTGKAQIASLLSPGQENAVPLRELESLTGYDSRTIRIMIQRERLNGTPILSDNLSGYFLPATLDEQRRCIRSMRHRAEEIRKVAEAIEKAEPWRG